MFLFGISAEDNLYLQFFLCKHIKVTLSQKRMKQR